MMPVSLPPYHLSTNDDLARIILCLSPVVAIILILGRPTTYGKLDGRKVFTTVKHTTGQSQYGCNNSTTTHYWLGPMLSSKWSWMIFESPCWIWTILLVLSMNKHERDVHDQQVPLQQLLDRNNNGP
jgi:hypothetical protein